ncbi:Ribosome-releasing factor 2, mitochondrial [Entophlyctis sp. JEL0112]|nr:Ribosome-releasing factor 2, mitochondrial [Entophlyctis sp. JEL0112]
MLRRCGQVPRDGRPNAVFWRLLTTSTAVSSDSIAAIRNIGIIAHIDAGKTTITERMLFYAGYTQRIGDVDSGSTVTDYLPAERARGITITSACIPLLWNSHRINLIDTPGHIDFTMEVERSVRVLDGAVVLLDGVAGVEAQTEGVWRQANRYRIPRILVANKMDRPGASFKRAIAAVASRLKGWGQPVAVQIPLIQETNSGPRFVAVADLVSRCVISFDASDTGSVVERSAFGSEAEFSDVLLSGGIARSKEEAASFCNSLALARADLVEKLSALDDTVVEAFLDADTVHMNVSEAVLKTGLRQLTLEGKIVPVLCASAFKNIGVQPVMDAVIEYLPNPAERQPATGTLPNGNLVKIEHTSSKFCAIAFKIIHDENRGAMVFIRVYSGVLEPKTILFNSTRNITERATKLLQMYADDYEEIPKVSVGNIACLVGLSDTRTGDTLLIASEHGINAQAAAKYAPQPPSALVTRQTWSTTKPASRPLTAFTLETIQLPEPVFVRSVEAATNSDARKLDYALTALTREDPSLVVVRDEDSGQTLLGGMGELHLEIAGERLRDTHRCKTLMGPVAIAYRETLSTEVVKGRIEYDKEIFGKHSKVTIGLEIDVLPLDHPEKEWVDLAAILRNHGSANTVDLSQVDMKDVFPSPLTIIPGSNRTRKDPTSEKEAKLLSPPGYPSIPDIYDALRAGIDASLARGAILGFPVVNVRVTVTELKLFKQELSSLSGIRAAVGRCMRDVMRGANGGDSRGFKSPMRLLEPVMDLTITVAERYVGNVTKDLTGTRRGSIVSLDNENRDDSDGEGGYAGRVITATVPLGTMVGYSTELRGMTAGTGVFSMKLLGYGQMSTDREEAVVQAAKGY